MLTILGGVLILMGTFLVPEEYNQLSFALFLIIYGVGLQIVGVARD